MAGCVDASNENNRDVGGAQDFERTVIDSIRDQACSAGRRSTQYLEAAVLGSVDVSVR